MTDDYERRTALARAAALADARRRKQEHAAIYRHIGHGHDLVWEAIRDCDHAAATDESVSDHPLQRAARRLRERAAARPAVEAGCTTGPAAECPVHNSEAIGWCSRCMKRRPFGELEQNSGFCEGCIALANG